MAAALSAGSMTGLGACGDDTAIGNPVDARYDDGLHRSDAAMPPADAPSYEASGNPDAPLYDQGLHDVWFAPGEGNPVPDHYDNGFYDANGKGDAQGSRDAKPVDAGASAEGVYDG